MLSETGYLSQGEMAEFCLMTSHGCPPGKGLVLRSEPGYNRFSKDFHSFLAHQGSNQVRFSSRSFDLSLQQKADGKFTSALLDRNNLITFTPDSTFKMPTSIQEPGSKPSGLRIADKCNSQEKILKLLASGSMGVENGLLDLSMLYDLMGHLKFAPFTQQSLIYPTREFYFNEPSVEYSCNPDDQQKSYFGKEMNNVFNEISCLYSSKTTNNSRTSLRFNLACQAEKSTSQHYNILSSTKKAGPVKRIIRPRDENLGPCISSHEKVRRKALEKKKSSTRTIKEREMSYLLMCEILLSILVNKEQQQTKNTIHLSKKSSPQLPEMLTQCSAC